MRPEKSHEPPSAGWKAGKLGRQFSLSLRPENRGTNAINARLRAGEDESRRSARIVRRVGGGGEGEFFCLFFFFLIRPSVD